MTSHNYLKIGLRSLRKGGLFSVINILGLAIGLAGCLLILQYVFFELSYNKFHENSKDIYRVSYSKSKGGVESFNTVLAYSGIGPSFKENFPEVLDFARLRPASRINSTTVIEVHNQVFEETRVYFADPSFLKMFSFKMTVGDPNSALDEQFSAIISESTAQKYFGVKDPIGQIFKSGNAEGSYTVTGVFEDIPFNSHVKFDFLLSHSTLSAILPESWTEENVTNFHGHMYLLMQPDLNLESFKSKLPKFVDDYIWAKQNKQEDTELHLAIMPLEEIHLNSHLQHESEQNGDVKVVKNLGLIAGLILFIAWVNYINLSTARSVERAKEVGVRKVLGASKGRLVRQFLVESALLNLLAIVVAIILFLLAQNLFQGVGAAHLLTLNPLMTTRFWLIIIVLFFMGLICSGIYPALALSSFKPLQVLRGKFYGSKKGSLLRRLLVIFQFGASVTLLIGTTIVFLQVDHMKNTDLGIDIANSLVVRAPLAVDSIYNNRFQGFKNGLLQHAAVKGVTAAFDVPGKEFDNAGWFKKVGDSDKNANFTYRTFVDGDFTTAMDIRLISGRQFVNEDTDKAMMINEAAMRQHGFSGPEEAIGSKITYMGFDDPDYEFNIIGVFKDYYQLSPKQEHRPEFVHYYPQAQKYYIVKYADQSLLSGLIGHAETTYNQFFTGNPFEYFFLDDQFDKQFESDRIFGDLFGGFAMLAIVVASLGLFGLSSYTVLQRTKEIGVRKVLGSSVMSIVTMLFWQFMKLILLANLVAWPLVYYFMNKWLESFANRISMPIWLFPIALLMVSVVAISTVSFHAVGAALSNPIKALRQE